MKVLSSFLGVDKTLAQTQIVSEGFTVGTVTQSDSTNSADAADHNKVILQSPLSGSLLDYESPISITWRNFSFTPAPYSFTPYSFTPGPYSFTPYSFTPYSFTPYSFTPYSFTPAPVEKYFSYAYCQNGSLNGYSGMSLSISGYATIAEACSGIAASLAPYGISQFTCVEGTASSPLYTEMGVVCSALPFSFTPAPPFSFTPAPPFSFTPAAAMAYWAACANPSAGYTAGQILTGSQTGTCAEAYQQQVSFGEISGGWKCSTSPLTGNEAGYPTFTSCGGVTPTFSFTPAPPFSFTPAPPFSFTPAQTFSFTPAPPFSFTPAPPFSFTPAPPFSFTPSTGCLGSKPYPYCVCQGGPSWVC